ncbi:probable G-protein coupled receptor 139 [Callorhinchus milii]|uniref:probable G-protein coupled receptor 139 n=1 Tax=Callorhinchus milii TaxID=7868 RepID=UPI0004572B58|nr:probable G-protein coupled receptor 139 [Callorhinchus milii]|eukprot:gi/632985047/ref/XP_007909462.1/ PREDICTED: probable G-protein coupled receptor 139 [Callorhinchus milii]
MHGPVTGQLFAVIYPVLAVIGIPGNLAVISVLSWGRCGLSKCITCYLVGMATSDLLVLVFAVVLNRIQSLYFPNSFLSISPSCRINVALVYVGTDSSVWLTTAFTFDRYIAICCGALSVRYCQARTARLVAISVYTFFGLKNILWYFALEPEKIVNNVPWFCVLTLRYYTTSHWIAFSWLNRVLTPCVPFLLILFFNVLTVRHILFANRVRARLRQGRMVDTERNNRQKSIVALFTISAGFFLLWSTYLAHMLYYRLTRTFSYSPGTGESAYLLQEMGFLLLLVSSSTNTCLYTFTQSKFKQELRNALLCPLRLSGRLLNARLG